MFLPLDLSSNTSLIVPPREPANGLLPPSIPSVCSSNPKPKVALLPKLKSAVLLMSGMVVSRQFEAGLYVTDMALKHGVDGLGFKQYFTIERAAV